jgi:hypothetical protein
MPCGLGLGSLCRTGGTVAVLLATSAVPGKAEDSYGAPQPDIKDRLTRLVESYPDWIAGFDHEFLVLKNGTKFAISDHRTDKSFDELLEKPDIDDMFYASYPAGSVPRQPAKNVDPGRVRFGPLFAAMYGDCKKNEVTRKLRTIDWLPQHGGSRVAITTVNGVDKMLEAVSRDLANLSTEFIKYLKPTAGTYNCRMIAGSSARSMHAYAAAIDINVAFSDYWRWASRNGREPVWRNRIPSEVVQIFERHRFIWGGYWYHFDTMHFEYRPELFAASSGAKSN